MKLHEITNRFYRFDGDLCGNNGTGLTVYRPVEKTEFSKIAVLAMPGLDYMGFYPIVEMARRGFTAAGIAPKNPNSIKAQMEECSDCITFLKNLPGVEKVVLMGYSRAVS
jgi:hypothetical protein